MKKNSIEFKVYGRYGLFTDPVTRVGGEKFSYQIPTNEALKGICESIYWKPTFRWVVDDLRVMKPIRTHSQGMRPINFDGENSLSYYTYLADVEYQVRAHFVWNDFRTDLKDDRNENKHYFIAKRMLERGGRRDIFLGTRECQGYVEPVNFGQGKGFYDNYGDLKFDLMFYGFEYPSNSGENNLTAKFWKPEMRNGCIHFDEEQANEYKRHVKEMDFEFLQTSGSDEPGLLEGYIEETEL